MHNSKIRRERKQKLGNLVCIENHYSLRNLRNPYQEEDHRLIKT
jgi:hypothetical protein